MPPSDAKLMGGGYWTNYISKTQTNAINGVFVLLVFIRHFSQYIEFDLLNTLFPIVDGALGQFVVVPFLFYSGYGIMYSILTKEEYISTRLVQRFFWVWVRFTCAVVLFVILNILLNIQYDIKTIVLAFTGWTSIGNSNWYILAVLALYIFTIISFSLSSDKTKGVLLMFIFALGYAVVLRKLGKGTWYYDTIIAYPFGMLFCRYKNSFEKIVMKNICRYGVLIIIITMLARVLYTYRVKWYVHELFCCATMMTLVLISMKISLGNKWIEFLGKYTFEIYILQRIPLVVLQNYNLPMYIYFALSLVLTIVLALVFSKTTNKILKTLSLA